MVNGVPRSVVVRGIFLLGMSFDIDMETNTYAFTWDFIGRGIVTVPCCGVDNLRYRLCS